MATKKKAKKKATKTTKAKAAPKLTDKQLETLKRVAGAPAAAAAYDRRTLNSLIGKKLVQGSKTVSVTKAGSAFLGA